MSWWGLLLNLLLACLSLILSIGTSHAEETRLQGFDRFGRAVEPIRGDRAFPYITARGRIRGFLTIARVGQFDSVFPYDYQNSKRNERPEQFDDLVYESLMLEDPLKRTERLYPLIADAVRVNENYSSVTFEIAKDARFTDGIDITGADVYMSYMLLKTSYSEMESYLGRVVKDVVIFPKEVRFALSVSGQAARDAIMIIAQMKIVRANTTGNPLMGGIPVRYTGSGPYSITQLGPNKAVLLRNQFYWGDNLPTRKGYFNMRQIEILAYSNQESASSALGNSPVNFYVEERQTAIRGLSDRLLQSISTVGRRSQKRHLPSAPKRSYVFNITRPHLQDVRVRKALLLAFDFDLINQVYHLNQLERPSSLMQGSLRAPKGAPPHSVRELLNRCDLPSWKLDNFETYGNALYRQVGDKRTRLLSIARLMHDSGYALRNERYARRKQDGTFEPIHLKFIAYTTTEINQLTFYKAELARLGIEAELVIPTTREELENLLASGDYDLAPVEERLLSVDMIPRIDLAKSLFAVQQVGPGRSGTVALNRLDQKCVETIIGYMENQTPEDQLYFDLAQALARIQQILYLNIFAGDSKVTNYFLDHRFAVPPALDLSELHVYGYWDARE